MTKSSRISPPNAAFPPPVLAIVGAGAAGLAAAIFAARSNNNARILLLDGAKKPGAKILVSGGGRCNVTNVRVGPDDFRGGNRHFIRNVLRALTVEQTIEFFRGIGVALHEEEFGKLFPDSNKARTVLDALLVEAARLGVTFLADHRVSAIEYAPANVRSDASIGPPSGELMFQIRSRGADGPQPTFDASRIILATGGLSLPKTGSDGGGYELARSLGHSIVPTTPALVPLLLDGDFHSPLSGVSHDAEVTLHPTGEKPLRIRGPVLWTHFGLSGPAALDASGPWSRARLDDRDVLVTLSFVPDSSFDALDAQLASAAAAHPRSSLKSALAELLPARLAEALLAYVSLEAAAPLAQLARVQRRKLVHALLDFPLPVRDTRGYAFAEVTAGGVHLAEVNSATLESRVCPGLHFAGEILDANGRLGGFNFQWAWSTGFVAGSAAARSLSVPRSS